MKTNDLFGDITLKLLYTAAIAYLVNFIFEAPIVWAWVGACFLFLSRSISEYVRFRRDQSPTLLLQKVRVLEEKQRKKQIEGDQIKNVILENEFLKSELENASSELESYKSYAKAAFDLQQAETEKSDAKALEYKANWENAEATVSELKAKLVEVKASENRWAADCSRAQGELRDTLKTLTTNNSDWEIEKQSLEAKISELQNILSELDFGISEFIAKFGYGFFSNHWATFKKAISNLNSNYSTNRLNAISTVPKQDELMLSKKSVQAFAEFMPQEAEVLEFKGEE